MTEQTTFADLVERMKQRLDAPTKVDTSISRDTVIIRAYSEKPVSAWRGSPSGIEVIHVPTGIRVTCTSERSQHKNKAICLQRLQAELTKRYGGAPC